MRAGRDIWPASCAHRFRDNKIKRLYLFITRYSNSNNKRRLRKVRRAHRTLIMRVGESVGKARVVFEFAQENGNFSLLAVAAELADFLPLMAMVVEQSRRTQLDGERVPAAGKGRMAMVEQVAAQPREAKYAPNSRAPPMQRVA